MFHVPMQRTSKGSRWPAQFGRRGIGPARGTASNVRGRRVRRSGPLYACRCRSLLIYDTFALFQKAV